jgi:AmmeMemoRadiSam system protein B
LQCIGFGRIFRVVMHTVRQPVVAGAFYPANPAVLRADVADYLECDVPPGDVPRAVIAPHAGYVYSGPIAGSAYRRLVGAREAINRVLLLGPSHRVAFRGIAATGMDAFATPLGDVPVDQQANEIVLALPFVHVREAAHAQEHGLEVHLPFLMAVLDSFSIVPLVVGDASPDDVAAVIKALWSDTTLVVVSSDLSHYHDYLTARRMDAATSEAIRTLHPEAIGHDAACGRIAVNGLLTFARRHGLQAEVLDLRNSGDTVGSRDQVVGYGAYVFT